MVLLEKCCFCVSLRSGGVALGIVSIVINIIVLALVALLLIAALVVNGDDIGGDDTILVVLRVILFIYLAVTVLALISAILLIFGARKNRESFLMPYLIINGISCVLQVVGLCVNIYDIAQGTAGAGLLVGNIIAAVLYIYLWLCVQSLYQMIKSEKRQGSLHPTTQYPAQNAI